MRLDDEQYRSPEAGLLSPTRYFVTANRYVAKKASNIKTLADLKGKTVVSTSGTTNLKWLTEENGKQNLGMSILAAKDHAEAFLMVETDRAAAFFMDDILLASLVAGAKTPADYADRRGSVLGRAVRRIMLRRDDPAFQKVADNATAQLYKSGAIMPIYEKWFQKPIPPKGIMHERAGEPAAQERVRQSDEQRRSGRHTSSRTSAVHAMRGASAPRFCLL